MDGWQQKRNIVWRKNDLKPVCHRLMFDIYMLIFHSLYRVLVVNIWTNKQLVSNNLVLRVKNRNIMQEGTNFIAVNITKYEFSYVLWIWMLSI